MGRRAKGHRVYFTRVQAPGHLHHQRVQMLFNIAQLFQACQLGAGAGRTVLSKGERYEHARGVPVHAAHHQFVVEHQPVHLVHRGRRCLGTGAGFQHRVSGQIQHARGHGVFVYLRRVAAQREQIQQHLRVQAAIHLVQIKCFVSRFVIHHAQIGPALPLHYVHTVYLALHLHGTAVRRAQRQRRNRALPCSDLLLKGGRVEQALGLLRLKIRQQTRYAALQPFHQIGKAPPCGGHVFGHVLVGHLAGQPGQLLRRKTRELRARAAHHVLQDIMHQAAALQRRKLRASARTNAQDILQKVRKPAAVILFHTRG